MLNSPSTRVKNWISWISPVIYLRNAIKRLAPDDIHYEHNARWGDGNGRSHIRAALVGPDLTVPVRNGSLLLGTWQQIVLVELDLRGRSRTVHLTVTGKAYGREMTL
jgi:secondary thiamine-phosphate synthase enzyme